MIYTVVYTRQLNQVFQLFCVAGKPPSSTPTTSLRSDNDWILLRFSFQNTHLTHTGCTGCSWSGKNLAQFWIQRTMCCTRLHRTQFQAISNHFPPSQYAPKKLQKMHFLLGHGPCLVRPALSHCYSFALNQGRSSKSSRTPCRCAKRGHCDRFVECSSICELTTKVCMYDIE